MSDTTPVFVAGWRKRIFMARRRTIRKYLSRFGRPGTLTEKWEHARRFTTRDEAERAVKVLGDRPTFVVEETRELPAPKVSAGLTGGLWS